MGQIIHVIFSVSVRRRRGLERSPVQHFNIALAGGARIDRDVAALHGVRRHRLDLLLDRLAADPGRSGSRCSPPRRYRSGCRSPRTARGSHPRSPLKFARVHLEGADVIEDLEVAAVVGERVVLRDDRSRTAFATPCGTSKYALIGWLIAWTLPRRANENAIPANSEPTSIFSAASMSSRHATKRRMLPPSSSIAFSAIASENGDAARET